MRLTPPSTALFVVSALLALLAFFAHQGGELPLIGENPFWVLFVGWVILAIGCLFRRI
jgi:hypothetical protein